MKKLLFLFVVVTLAGGVCAKTSIMNKGLYSQTIEALADSENEISPAEITCSSGDRGRCFAYVEANTVIPKYDCVWSGRQKDNCTYVGIALRWLRDLA